MPKISYTKKTVINSAAGIISYCMIMLTTMIVRIVFSHFLSKELLGLNSLFSSILDLLLISELGISTAMVVFLYEPVKNKNEKQINLIMQFYAKIYLFFCLVLFLLGILVLFFAVPKIVHVTSIPKSEVKTYFFLFLVGTLGSYIYAHLKSLFYASQQNNVVAIGNAIQRSVVAVLQCVILIKFKNFYLFLIIRLIGYVIENLVLRYIVLMQFPFLRFRPSDKLDKVSIQQIVNTVKPIFITQLADKVLAQTDTILINKFVNIVMLGIFSNYNLIITAGKGLFNPIGSALTTSYGGLTVNTTSKQKYEAFNKSYPFAHFATQLICSFFIVFIQDFIYIAFGESFLLSKRTCIILTAYLYFDLIKSIYYSYQNALGLQRLDQKQMVLQVPFNIISSVALALIYGLDGIILGTVLTLLVFPLRYKGFILFKKVFEIKPMIYYWKSIKDLIQSIFIMFFLFFFSSLYSVKTIPAFLCKVPFFTVLILLVNIGIFSLEKSNREIMFSFIRRKVLCR